jgi:hypothetical protein
MSNRSVETGCFFLILEFRGNGFTFSPLSMVLGTGLSYIAYEMLQYIAFISSFLRAFIMKWCWILSKAFSVYIEMIKWFFSLLILMCCITFNDLHMLNHPAFLEWSWLGHGEWFFWYFIVFSLPLFYWGFLHQCSLSYLAFILYGYVLVWFWDECNTGFIEWVGKYSFPLYFKEK